MTCATPILVAVKGTAFAIIHIHTDNFVPKLTLAHTYKQANACVCVRALLLYISFGFGISQSAEFRHFTLHILASVCGLFTHMPLCMCVCMYTCARNVPFEWKFHVFPTWCANFLALTALCST